ncbi:BglI family type II restriction endonuclease [Schaalia sp. lx-100]|uniref:BglI family type II restriction endonuclease n=1 Tax=Schaalia sp. lx-100 TaxID=2899081 RepID=UPI001E2B459E|nr:BglI family type II restriction endonuclease [Schaalia sp. lx-100]MCD4557011.1 BglI family type II restriction endonuclease [Schaalia sp. lx-100]
MYQAARNELILNPEYLLNLEKYIAGLTLNLVTQHYLEIKGDYDEASLLEPFWRNYPPDHRGRGFIGDQIPWIEVGEHAIGHRLNRLFGSLQDVTEIREVGLPTGADNRFLIRANEISTLTNGLTDAAFVFLDIKSVGPRDEAEHAVLSPFQVSGDGVWDSIDAGLENTPVMATGKRSSHPFHPAASPIYILSDGTVAPTIHIFVKPKYGMNSLQGIPAFGQELEYIRIITVPNGLLLCENPNLLRRYPTLLFPGKDDKTKPALKVRCRVDFSILSKIDSWRVQKISI